MMLILPYAVVLGCLPTAGRGETVSVLGVPISLLMLDGLQHLALPAINLAIPSMALMIRLASAGTTETVTRDYVNSFIRFIRPTIPDGSPPRRAVLDRALASRSFSARKSRSQMASKRAIPA